MMETSLRRRILARVAETLAGLFPRTSNVEAYPGSKVFEQILNGPSTLGDQQEIIAIAAMISASEAQT